MRKIDPHRFVRATRATPRAINRRIVLNLVREHQPVSRADLARRMGLGRGMVTTLVDELLADGEVYEGDAVDAPRGRRPRMLYLRTLDRLVLAVDVRYSRTYLMLADFGGRALAFDSFTTIVEPARFVDALATHAARLLRDHATAGRCEGVGVVVPGMVDPRTGYVLSAPQLGWRDVALRAALAEATGLPVEIENASIACALSHMWLGTASIGAARDFVYVNVSDGVGAGIVVNGQVVRGASCSAGEFGHIPIDLNGPTCLCGARGCLEAYTSNLATLCRYLGAELSAANTRTLLHDAGLTMATLTDRAAAGDARAAAALRETGRYLGVGLASIVNALNPARIYVGGELTAAWPEIVPGIEAALASRALTAAGMATPIIPEPAGNHPRLRGATALIAAPLFAAPIVA